MFRGRHAPHPFYRSDLAVRISGLQGRQHTEQMSRTVGDINALAIFGHNTLRQLPVAKIENDFIQRPRFMFALIAQRNGKGTATQNTDQFFCASVAQACQSSRAGHRITGICGSGGLPATHLLRENRGRGHQPIIFLFQAGDIRRHMALRVLLRIHVHQPKVIDLELHPTGIRQGLVVLCQITAIGKLLGKPGIAFAR